MGAFLTTLLLALLNIISIGVVTKFILWLTNYISMIKEVNKIPGIWRMIPLIGNIHKLKSGSEFYQQLMHEAERLKNEGMLRLWIGTQPVIVVTKAELLDFLLSGSSKSLDKSSEYRFLHPWLGTGLLTSTGEKWLSRRKLITPSFHFEILSDFLLVMNEKVDIFIERLTAEEKLNKTFDISPYISSLALDIICETAMGKNIEVQRDKNSKYVNAVVNISEYVFERFKNPFYYFDFIFNNSNIGQKHDELLKIIHDFTKKVIVDRSNEYDEQGSFGHRKAFLDTLLEAKKNDESLTFDDLREEVDTFMFEGHDTTAAALSWASYLIASNLDAQKKLHDEIDSVFGNSDRHVTNEDLTKLKYLECCIKETLRIYPSVAFYGRSMNEEVKCNQYSIPEGSTIVILAAQVHRDEKHYKNPEKFVPERFLPENTANRHPFAYIPFSAGKRNCVGQRFALMEMKVVLANLLRKFELTTSQTEVIQDFELILRPKNGILVKLKVRSKNF